MTDNPAEPLVEIESVGTLAAEHAGLLREVSARCEAVTSAVGPDHWPTNELHRLLDYLHVEVLQQVVDEEWLLFRDWHHAGDTVQQLRAEHADLRRGVEELTDAATGASQLSTGELATLISSLLRTLGEHFRAEQELLHDPQDAPSTSSLGAVPHEWYVLTEGPVIDLSALPGRPGVDAVLGRLLRLGSGDHVELIAASDPRPLWRRLAAADPDGYGFSHVEHGPPRWRVEIERRSTG